MPGQPIYLNGSAATLFINPAAFAPPAPGTFGNLSRGLVRQPSISNVDFSMNKNFALTERYRLQLRAEFFNVFNHPSFNGFGNSVFGAGGLTIDRPTGSQFGVLNSDRGPRNIQFGVKMNF